MLTEIYAPILEAHNAGVFVLTQHELEEIWKIIEDGVANNLETM